MCRKAKAVPGNSHGMKEGHLINRIREQNIGPDSDVFPTSSK